MIVPLVQSTCDTTPPQAWRVTMKSQIIYNPFRHYLPRVHISFVLHTTASFPFLRNWFFYCSSLPLFFLRFLFLKAQNLFSLSFLTHLRFLQIQPIPSSPGTHPFCLFSFTSHSSTVSLIRFNPFFALYAIPTGLILRFLTQSLRFCCCSFDLDCGFFSFSIFFGWIVGIENFAGFWIWVWILWWSGWFCRSGVFWVDLVVLVDGVFVDFTWIEFIDVFLLNSVDLVYIGVMDLLVLGWLQIELRGN